MDLVVMPIDVYNSVADLPDDVRQALSYPNQPEYFLSADWFAVLSENALADEIKPRIYVNHQRLDHRVTAIFAARSTSGRSLASLTTYYSLLFAPVADSSRVPTSSELRELFDFIANERPRWNEIDFRYLLADEREVGPGNLASRMKQSGYLPWTYFQYENWYLNVGDQDFESYFAARSSRLRNTIRRKEKKLKKSCKVSIEQFDSPGPNLDKAIEDFVAVYNRSWKKPEPYDRFIPALIRNAAAHRILRLGILYINDAAAAAQLWITTGDKSTIYKLAYDDEYSNFSPGSLLSRELFRQAIDADGVKIIDYGIGSESYKREWMNEVRRIKGVRAYCLRTVPGIGKASLEFASRIGKRIARSRP